MKTLPVYQVVDTDRSETMNLILIRFFIYNHPIQPCIYNQEEQK